MRARHDFWKKAGERLSPHSLTALEENDFIPDGAERDNFAGELLAIEWRDRRAGDNADLDAVLATGWAKTPRARLPRDWRSKRGPHQPILRSRGAA